MHPTNKADLAKLDRASPRNFAGMNEATVIAMATLAFCETFATKGAAVAALKQLPISMQHALSKTEAQAYARRVLVAA